VTRALVIGAGGLLGGSISDALNRLSTVEVLLQPNLEWSRPESLRTSLRKSLCDLLCGPPSEELHIYWCAGRGTPRSPENLIRDEEKFLHVCTKELTEQIRVHGSRQLTMFFASSAGGVYGHTQDSVATEISMTNPTELYGRTKLSLEAHLLTWAQLTGVQVLIGRISSLYGPRQNLNKRQGFLSQLALTVVLGSTLEVFTSLQTTRNYISADSAAQLITHYMTSNSAEPYRVRNICSPNNVSVAELLQIATRLNHRPIPTTYSGDGSPSHLRVSSQHLDELHRQVRQVIHEGFAQLVSDIRMRFATSGAQLDPSLSPEPRKY